jgi:ribosomal protein L19E
VIVARRLFGLFRISGILLMTMTTQTPLLDPQELESVLSAIPASRREILRKLIMAGPAMAVALALPSSALFAEEEEGDGKGKGDAKGKGKGKGDGDGKGKGKGDGKGKGKGKGKGDDQRPAHEQMLTEIRAMAVLVGAPSRDKVANESPDDKDEPPHEQVLRELRDLRKFLESQPKKTN